jgi:hypothetical protein
MDDATNLAIFTGIVAIGIGFLYFQLKRKDGGDKLGSGDHSGGSSHTGSSGQSSDGCDGGGGDGGGGGN